MKPRGELPIGIGFDSGNDHGWLHSLAVAFTKEVMEKVRVACPD